MRLLLVVMLLVASFRTWGCYYDVGIVKNGCLSHPTTKFYISNCQYPQWNLPQQIMVSCFDPAIATDAYSRWSNSCTGSATPLENFKTCPIAPAPKAVTTVNPNKSQISCGSVIQVDSQVLTEKISLSDVPYSLVYSSQKVFGRKEMYEINIPITNQSYTSNPQVTGYELQIKVADQVFNQTFMPSAGISHKYVWDGKDASGAFISGSQNASISILETYVSPVLPADFPIVSPYAMAKMDSTKNQTSSRYMAPIISTVAVGSIFGTKKFGIGGWDFDVHHSYDPVRKILYMGDGSTFNTGSQVRSSGNIWVLSQDRSQLFVFDVNYNHIETRNALTNILKFSFSYNSGALVALTDVHGNSTTIQYSGGDVTSITSPNGVVTELELDGNAYLSSVSNPLSQSYEMTYSSDGLLLTFTKPSGNISTMVYDASGRLILDSNSEGSSVGFSKALVSGKDVITETSAMGRIKSHESELTGVGYSRKTIFPNSRNQIYSENLNSGLMSSRDGFGSRFSEAFTTDTRFGIPFKRPSSVTEAYGNYSKTTSFSETAALTNPSDPFSFSTLTAVSSIGGKNYQSVYNANTKTLVQQNPAGTTETTILNIKGLPTSYQYASYTPITIVYDTDGQVSALNQGTARKTQFSYDPVTRKLASVENSLSETTSFTYDLVGRITSQTLPDSRVINYNYDIDGNLSSVEPPSRPAHEFNYNGHGQVSHYIPPLLAGVSNVTTTYFYNNDRELIQMTRPNGQSVFYNYNSVSGNLGSITLPTGTRNFTHNFSTLYSRTSTSEDFVVRNSSISGTKLESDHSSSGGFSSTISNGYYTDNNRDGERLIVKTYDSSIAFGFNTSGLMTSAGTETITRSMRPSDQTPITRLSIQPRLANLDRFHVDEGTRRTIYGSFHTAPLQRGSSPWTTF